MKLKKRFASPHFSTMLNISAIIAFLGLVEAWILTFYYKVNFNEWVGWIAEDYVSDSKKAFGVHYFSDYLAMIDLNNSSGDARFTHPYPPFAILIYKMFTYFPYKFGVLLWLVLLVFAMLYPVWKAFKKQFPTMKYIGTIILVGLSYPFIATLDRANIIGLLPCLLFLSYIEFSNKKFLSASVFLAIAINIKIYPVLILVMLLKRENIRFIINTILSAATIFIVSSFLWSPSDPIRAMKSAFLNASKLQTLNLEGHGLIVSASQIVYNVLLRLRLTNSDISDFFDENFKLIGLLFLIILTTGASLSSNHEKWLFGLYAMQLVPSMSWSYTRIWTAVGFGILILKLQKRNNEYLVSSRDSVWWLVLISNSTLITIFSHWPINLLPTFSFLVVIFLSFHAIFSRFWRKVGLKVRPD
jgi:hypothetical protein